MKIFEFINLISHHFSTEIFPAKKGAKIKNSDRYQFVLSWFTDDSADEIEQVSKVIMKSDDYCSKLLNPNTGRDMSYEDASYLKSKINASNFSDVFDKSNLTNGALEALRNDFEKHGYPISDKEIVKEITDIFIKLLNDATKVKRKKSIKSAEFLGDNTLRIGNKKYTLPEPLKVPNLPHSIENKYVNALFEVYSQKTKKSITSLTDLESKPIYKYNLQIHREAFYSAESVLRQIRDFFTDGTKEFNMMKQELYDAIKYHLSLPNDDAFNKLNETMDLVIKISFKKSYLSKAGNGLIGPEEQRGMVHMLVNDGKVRWL